MDGPGQGRRLRSSRRRRLWPQRADQHRSSCVARLRQHAVGAPRRHQPNVARAVTASDRARGLRRQPPARHRVAGSDIIGFQPTWPRRCSTINLEARIRRSLGVLLLSRDRRHPVYFNNRSAFIGVPERHRKRLRDLDQLPEGSSTSSSVRPQSIPERGSHPPERSNPPWSTFSRQ